MREERRLKVFENRVLRRTFGPKRDEVTEELRKLHDEELNDLYSSPNNLWVIKPRRMRWAAHVARMGRGEACSVLVGKLERDHWGHPSLDWKIIMRWIFRKWEVSVWTGSGWLRIGTAGGHL